MLCGLCLCLGSDFSLCPERLLSKALDSQGCVGTRTNPKKQDRGDRIVTGAALVYLGTILLLSWPFLLAGVLSVSTGSWLTRLSGPGADPTSGLSLPTPSCPGLMSSAHSGFWFNHQWSQCPIATLGAQSHPGPFPVFLMHLFIPSLANL